MFDFGARLVVLLYLSKLPVESVICFIVLIRLFNPSF